MKKRTQKFIKRHHRRAKKRAKFMLRHPLLLPVVLFFLVVFFGLGIFVTVGASTQGAQDKRIVNIYVDGEKQTVSTRAKTVDVLLERLDIDLLDEDIVEPARDTIILEDNTQVNIYRARPVAVVDGDRIITVLSAHRSARLVANAAGLKLLAEDEVSFGRNIDGVLEVSAAEQVVVKRSVQVKLVAYGVLSNTRTTADTVGEFLDNKDIVLGEQETLQPNDRVSPITDGMLISINKPGILTDVVSEPVGYEVELREDASMTVGESRVEQAGVEGEQAVIYEITADETGQEVSRRALQTVVTRAPVNEIRVRGTKPATLSSNVNVSAEKSSIMSAAGISSEDYGYVDFIISHESGWRPGAHNSSSGAYGLCQALPASKMASSGGDYLTNPVTQLRWCTGYASGRYGGWQGAYNAWLAQRWW